jgi:hypothetical protein
MKECSIISIFYVLLSMCYKFFLDSGNDLPFFNVLGVL